MSEDIKISAAANVEIPAYLTLKEKGYGVCRKKQNDETEFWYAEKNKLQFMAESPLELLGVVSVYELRGSNWKATDVEITKSIEELSK